MYIQKKRVMRAERYKNVHVFVLKCSVVKPKPRYVPPPAFQVDNRIWDMTSRTNVVARELWSFWDTYLLPPSAVTSVTTHSSLIPALFFPHCTSLYKQRVLDKERLLQRERTERNGLQTLPLSFCCYKEPLHLPKPVFSNLFCCCVFTLGSDSFRSW